MKSRLLGAVCACVFSLVMIPSHAALIGVLPVTPGGSDWQALYNDVADLTWLVNANLAGTSMSLADANNWAASLDVSGVTGWRLPSSDSCTGYNCTGSELGNMFYNVLGGTATQSLATSHNSNYDLFSDIQPFYWSDTGYVFINTTGLQNYFGGTGSNYAWAVQSGDVAVLATPIPAAVWLFGSGLLGLVGMARRRKSA